MTFAKSERLVFRRPVTVYDSAPEGRASARWYAFAAQAGLTRGRHVHAARGTLRRIVGKQLATVGAEAIVGGGHAAWPL
jgi:hypothetical protein